MAAIAESKEEFWQWFERNKEQGIVRFHKGPISYTIRLGDVQEGIELLIGRRPHSGKE